MINDIDLTLVAKYLNNAQFQFRTLEEAHIIAEFLAYACPNPRLAIMGITEIFVNAIEHGNLSINYDEKSMLQHQDWIAEIERRLNLPENINKYVHVHFLRQQHELHIKVIDEGTGFDWKKYQPDPTQKSIQIIDTSLKSLEPDIIKKPLDSHGRGIIMASNLFSRIEFSARGNEILCVVPL